MKNLEIKAEVNVKIKVTQNGRHNSPIPEESTHQLWDHYLKYNTNTLFTQDYNM